MKNPITKKTGRSRVQKVNGQVQTVVGFRLDPEQLSALTEQADERGVSPHRLAHDFVIEGLEGKDEADDIAGEFQILRRQLFELREELALITEALLVSAGKTSSETARNWVDSNLKP
jgi:hypothetical protein